MTEFEEPPDERFARVPRADDAWVPPEKLTKYALDPEAPDGRHKARVFAAVLGIGNADWEYLRDQLLEGVRRSPYVGIRIHPWGRNYEVPMMVEGLNGS